MTRSDTEILPQVQQALADALQLPLEQILPGLAFGGIPQWDSMGHMSVMMLLEERFNISIDADVIAELTSVTAICEYILRTGGKA